MKTTMILSEECVINATKNLGDNPLTKNQNITKNKYRKRKHNESYI